MADEIERWSEELARDPGSRVFLPLAEALRRRGQTDLALRIALRGLARRPEDADAHDLLARIWTDRGDLQQAMDEWSAALTFNPTHVGALKGMGFSCYQLGRGAEAQDYLSRALAAAPDDPSIRAALAHIEIRTPAVAESGETDPQLLFVDLLGNEQAALLVDGEGLVLAGTYVLVDGLDVASDVAAALSGVSAEATRAMRHLGVGDWTSLVIETDAATVALAPMATDRATASTNGTAAAARPPRSPARAGIALLAAGHSVPLGLVRRLLARIADRSRAWLATHGAIAS
jgi:tetratricopeptide (TPR) repeat protein